MPEVLDVPAAKLVKKGQHLILLLLQSHTYTWTLLADCSMACRDQPAVQLTHEWPL